MHNIQACGQFSYTFHSHYILHYNLANLTDNQKTVVDNDQFL